MTTLRLRPLLVAALQVSGVLLLGPLPAEADARLGVLAGPTNLEAEWRTTQIYADAGLWVPGLFLPQQDGWTPPAQLRFGARLPLSKTVSARFGPRMTLMVTDGFAGVEDVVEEQTGSLDQTSLFLSADVGLRYEAASGFLLGVDMPLFTVVAMQGVLPPPLQLFLVQLYAGWQWDVSAD